MLPLSQYRGTTVGILGLGPEGQACVRALLASGARVLAWDADAARRSESGAKTIPPAEWSVGDLAAVFLADGTRGGGSLGLVDRAAAARIPVLNDLDLFARAIGDMPESEKPTVVAVTGAAGKSVTVAMIAHILRDNGRDVAIGGHVGVPVMALPEPRKGRIYVLELPVRRLTTTRSLHADVSVVLNVSSGEDPDQVEMALRSILRVFKSQGPNDTAIVGVDDVLGQKICTLLRSGQLAAGAMGTVIPVSGESALSHGVFALEGAAYSARLHKTQTLGDFSRAAGMLGPHFQRDAAAATAVCLSLGLPPAMIIKSIHSFRGLEGRFECLGAAGRVLFVDDSFASCTAAARQSVRTTLDVFWVGGDGIARAELSAMGAGSVHAAYLVGDGRAPAMRVGTSGGGEGMQVRRFSALREAVASAYGDAVKLAKSDPEAAPVVLCAPGVPLEDGRFAVGAFRDMALDYISQEARYAS